MNGEQTRRWTAVRAIFEEVVDLPRADRSAALAARCNGDATLQAEVERLLHADADAGAMVTPDRVIASLKATDDPLGAAARATQIAGFTVRRLLGAGGMGAVYEAEQQSPRRLVALKVLRPELCTGATVRRFQVEAEILGRLQHQGIAEVFAAGVHRTDAGPFRWELPFYAMELLHGAQPITTYAREHDLPLRQRLALFAQVCAAVHHAHQRGVIHRDLKPGNVLVDERGQPKVIDFGVARAIHRDPGAETMHTKTGVQVGTPSYMAPEQVAGAADIDVRCDVWALGVMLYELLSDRLPFADDATTPTPAAAAFLRPPPSLRRLRADIAPELDWIVGKALAVERDRRYQTAADLADDLDRLRRHETVRAAPPSRLYQLRKAVRRHKTLSVGLGVGLSCLLAGLLSTSLALRVAHAAEVRATQSASEAQTAEALAQQAARDALAQAQRATAEKERADAARADAEASAASAVRAHQNAATMLDLIQSAAQAASRRVGGRDVTVAALWEQLAARADADPSLSALQRATAFNYLGAVRFYGADYPAAQAYFERSLAALSAEPSLGTREEITAHSSLSEALRLQGKYAESEAALTKALALADQLLRPDEAQALALRRRWAFVLLNHGRHDEAVVLCRELLAARVAAAGEGETRETAEARMDLATALLMAGDAEGGEASARQAYTACRATFGIDSERTANAARNLAEAMVQRGQVADAQVLLRQALTDALTALPSTHPKVRDLQEALGRVLQRLGDHSGAIELFAQCLAASSTAAPHERLALVSRLSAAHLGAGDAVAAEAVARDHLADQPQAPVIVQRALLAVQLAHGRALIALGRSAEAASALAETLQRASERLGADHAVTREIRDELQRVRPP